MASVLFGCNDFLDREPLSEITPESYLTEESQLAAYANYIYVDVMPSHEDVGGAGIFAADRHTDFQADRGYNNRYVPGEWKTPSANGTVNAVGIQWEFSWIFSCNYFLENVLPKFEAGAISGSPDNIRHYIGEIYVLRAYEYFKKLQEFGDYPIITTVLPDEKEALVEASKRSPRNEVARFILSDLDTAIPMLLETAPDGKKNRISKATAQMIKSRVALFEGTWLKYFKGTAFVPNGSGWPGSSKDYNAGYQYPSGSIDNEINWFLDQAIEASAAVADKFTLVENTGTLQQSLSEPVNPYHNLFGDEDMSGYSEVIMWRRYDMSLGVTNGAQQYAQLGNNFAGPTRGMVDSYLMANGLPIYAPGSGYKGDDYLSTAREGRDGRLWLWLKEPGQINVLIVNAAGTHSTPIEIIPDITEGNGAWGYSTGYAIRKGNNYDQKHGGNHLGWVGAISFRSSEAMLNYMEAYYERHGTLDGKADGYWRALRNRAKVDPDYNKTIAATVMAEEAKTNWAAYSAGQLVDPTLFNIRRERSSELVAEGFRYRDLRRWRSMDQMITTPFHIEGFKLWGPMEKWYTEPETTGYIYNATELIYGLDNPAANVSSPELSQYLRPHEISSKSLVLNGYRWTMAHYLTPIAYNHFQISSPDGVSVANSPIYQNPGWPLAPNEGASDL
jgi:hypothetical protein